jgi:hypothetical protein
MLGDQPIFASSSGEAAACDALISKGATSVDAETSERDTPSETDSGVSARGLLWAKN